HGSSIVGGLIKNSKTINNSFEARYINLLVSRSIDETGKTNVFKLWRFLVSWFKLLIELIKEKPNLCYFALSTSGSAFYKDVTLILLLKLFRVKIVYHLHNKGVRKGGLSKFNFELYRYVFKNSNVILLSYYLYDDIKTFVSENDVYICANGIPDVEEIRENVNDKKQGECNQIVEILFLSNLIESKGVFVLLEACKIIQNKNISFYCTFVGGEADVTANKLLHKVKELNLENHVSYVGKKYDEEKIAIFSKTDIFAFPTYYHNETFGLVNLEAMQYSIPVVSTFEGGIPDVIDDGVTGFLVPQKDPQALAEKLELLIKNPELRIKMGAAGREKYEKEFTLQAFETKLQGILEHVLLK
ncbi:MAG: glycosyltransferase family 4 protein, partial [Bacteroidales bacterium]|nr:glycosyltransferase family 4 protein [Bacteroidales bacterium]